MNKKKAIAIGIILLISPFFYRAYIDTSLENQLIDILSMLVVIIGSISAIIIGSTDKTQ